MPCDAIATMKARINSFAQADQAIQDLTPEQARNLFRALLIEGTKFTQADIEAACFPGNPMISIIACGSLRATIRHTTERVFSAKIEDPFDDYTPAEYQEKINRINSQIVKAAGLIRQAKAVNLIQNKYGASLQTAPNGSKVLTFNY